MTAAVLSLIPRPGRALPQAWARLLIACSASLLVHLAMLLGIPAGVTGAASNVVAGLYARLEPIDDGVQPAQESTPVPAGTDVRPHPYTVGVQAASEPPSGMELPPGRDLTYYSALQLDVYPQPLTPIKLDFPDTAARRRNAGHLLLQLLIDESGMVNEVSMVDAQTEGGFAAPAISVLRATRFAPAQKQGRAVKCRVLLQVSYADGETAVR